MMRQVQHGKELLVIKSHRDDVQTLNDGAKLHFHEENEWSLIISLIFLFCTFR